MAGARNLDLEAILKYARGQLSAFKRPRGIPVRGELPKAGANIILRRSVRDKLLEAAKETAG